MTQGRSRSDSRGSLDIAGTLNGRSARSGERSLLPGNRCVSGEFTHRTRCGAGPGPAGHRRRNGYAIMYAMTEAAITVSGLTKAYGAKQAVAGLDLTVDRGEVFALLGPNGA